MNTQPTEAHRKLLSDLFSPLFYRNRDQALQLIANSEARAVDGAMRDTPWAANYIDMERELTAERDQLRAEVERLTIACDKFSNEEISQGDWKARAEKAEAALAEAKVERETVAQSSLRSLEAYMDKLKQFAARAEKAEADNAKWQKLLLMSRDDREIDLISEIEEQARLLGMSGEREADLLGKLERLERELETEKTTRNHLIEKGAKLERELAAMKGTP